MVEDFPSMQGALNSIPTTFSQNSQTPSTKTNNKIKTKIQRNLKFFKYTTQISEKGQKILPSSLRVHMMSLGSV